MNIWQNEFGRKGIYASVQSSETELNIVKVNTLSKTTNFSLDNGNPIRVM